MSAEGAALQRFPPSVARFRTCTDPTSAPLSEIAGVGGPDRGSRSSVARGDGGADPEAGSVGARELPELGYAGQVDHAAGPEHAVLQLGQEVGPPATIFASGLRARLACGRTPPRYSASRGRTVARVSPWACRLGAARRQRWYQMRRAMRPRRSRAPPSPARRHEHVAAYPGGRAPGKARGATRAAGCRCNMKRYTICHVKMSPWRCGCVDKTFPAREGLTPRVTAAGGAQRRRQGGQGRAPRGGPGRPSGARRIARRATCGRARGWRTKAGSGEGPAARTWPSRSATAGRRGIADFHGRGVIAGRRQLEPAWARARSAAPWSARSDS